MTAYSNSPQYHKNGAEGAIKTFIFCLRGGRGGVENEWSVYLEQFF